MTSPLAQTNAGEFLSTQPVESRAEGEAAPPAPGLIDLVIGKTPEAGPWLDEFLADPSPSAAFQRWLSRMSPGRRFPTPQALSRLLSCHIAAIDAMISRQLNAIIHHQRFQRLEASWRGLRHLVEQADIDEIVKIRVLCVSWQELDRDLNGAIEFDQSQLFRKVYSEEFGIGGGEPFSVLLGDYYVGRRLSPEHHTDDVAVLTAISQVAAAAFAPFVASADPELLGLTDFAQLERPMDLAKALDQPEHLKWRTLRYSEDSRFIGLTLPRALMRLPHADDGSRADGFCFREDLEAPDRSRYLWGNAAYAFGAVLIRAFAQSGWMTDIRGFQRDIVGGGLVDGLPVHSFSTDKLGVAAKFSTEVAIGDIREKELADLGFIPLCHCKDTDYCVFYSNQSVQRPQVYDKVSATVNARISAMLQYMLCVSRFAHYLKILARNKIGSFSEAGQLEDFLRNWLTKYVANDANASAAVRARYPLRDGSVQVRQIPHQPGSYQCVMHLLPHSQMDALTIAVKLVTELAPAQPA
jgi:type VI secretion system protein ImpD